MNLKSIIKTKEQIKKMGYGIDNNIIENVDIRIIGHFCNCNCLTIFCSNIIPYSGYNNSKNLGFLIKSLIELLDISKEDGIYISEIKNIPIRLVFDGESEGHWGEKAIGIGNFMKDKFILFDEFSKIDE